MTSSSVKKCAFLPVCLLFLFAVSSQIWAYPWGPPEGRAGDPPNNSTCTECHSSFSLNSGGGTLSLTGLPSSYTPGETYNITVDLKHVGKSRWGFELTVSDSNNNLAGNLIVSDSTNTQLSGKYLMQTLLGTFNGTSDVSPGWKFQWKAPSAGGRATFYATGNAANGDDSTGGDHIYSKSFSTSPLIPPVISIIATSSIPADGVSNSTIAITVKDSNNNPLSGKTVSLAVSGSGNVVSQPAATNVSGQTTATLKSTKAEIKTITATVDSVSKQTTATFVPGPVSANISTISASSSSISVDSAAEATITITLLDANSNPVSGKSVSISATGTGNSITQPTANTDANGHTTATIKSTKAGTKTISAVNTTDNISLTNTVAVAFFSNAPPIITLMDTTLSVASGTAKLFKVKVASANVIPADNVKLVYKSGENPFSALSMFDDGQHSDDLANDDIWARSLASSLVSLKGLSVYFTATDDKGNKTDTINLADGSKISLSIPAMVEVSGDLTTPAIPVWKGPEDWTMISFPVKLANEDPEVVFKDLGVPEVNWQAYQFNGGADYDRAIKIPRPENPKVDVEKFSSIGIGKAAWIWHDKTSSIAISAKGAKSQDPNKPFAIKVNSGWNQVGAPFLFNIPWNDGIKFGTTSDVSKASAILTAAANGQVANPPIIYLRSGAGYSKISAEATPSPGTLSGNLEPWKGYWFLAKTDGWVFVDPNTVAVSPPPIAPEYETYPSVAFKGWMVELNASGITINAGMSPSASNAQDKLDLISAPTTANDIRFAFANPQWNDKWAIYYDQDFKAMNREETTWTIEANFNGKPATIRWKEVYKVPKEYTLTLFDPVFGKIVDMANESSYRIADPDKSPRTLYLIASVGRGMPDQSLKPKKTELMQNFPNPFNPETWIPYQLLTEAEVSVEIYDVEGGLVRRLNLGRKPAGSYLSKGDALYWDGKNQEGESVSSGVYFYKFRAGDYASMRKMVILK